MKRAVLLLALAACSKTSAPPAAGSTSAPSAPPASTPAPSAAPLSSRVTDRFPTDKGELAVVPLEHATVLFQWNGLAIYADPTSSAVSDPSLPKADVVFLTDIHPDHLDPKGLAAVHKEGTIVVGPKAVADKTHVDVVLANGDTRPVLSLVATAVPMYNVKRGPAPGQLYHDKGRGNGYDIQFGNERVYLSGDTECTPEMKALQNIDVAFVCMNLPYTMPPSEAAECIEAFKPKVLFPYHYRGSDLTELDKVLAGKGIDVRKRDFYPGKP